MIGSVAPANPIAMPIGKVQNSTSAAPPACERTSPKTTRSASETSMVSRTPKRPTT